MQIIKHTDSRLKLWSTSHSSGLHHKFLFHPLFDITVNPRVQIHTEYENVYQLKSKQNWCTVDKELGDEKNGAQRHILETIFYWGQEKHLSDSSHTSRKLSMLSGCLSACTGGPVVTEVTGGDVLQFGLISISNIWNAFLWILNEKQKMNLDFFFFSAIKNICSQRPFLTSVTNCLYMKGNKRRKAWAGRKTRQNDLHVVFSVRHIPYFLMSLNGTTIWRVESRRKPPKKERWKENKWLRGQKEAFRSRLRVMASYVSQPLGPIYVRMSRVAGDAFNTAARDDTDPMRQTDRRTDSEARRGGREALCRKLRQTTYGPPPASCPVSKGLSSTIFRSPASLPNPAREKTTLHFFGFTCIYSLWTDLHVLFKYAPIWIHRVFVQDCVHAFLHACVLNVCVCVCARIVTSVLTLYEPCGNAKITMMYINLTHLWHLH